MKKISMIATASIIFALYIWTVVLGNDPLQPSIASKILRFHVLANSDSAEDQEVKEKVRDTVGIYLQPLLQDAENLTETKQIVQEHLTEVISLSEQTLQESGYDYIVQAQITETDFPEKTYGNYTFPKGRYEALQITIGEGDGKNWWCVLYPNMCFKGTVFEVIEEDAQEALREVLDPWEYADVFDSRNTELHFKFFELLSDIFK